MFVAQEVIRKKRDGSELSLDEIGFMVRGNLSGEVPDYQLSALLMAIFFRGLNAKETGFLLDTMIASGKRYDWKEYQNKRIFVDKHSTGGVGDKTSLVVLPLLVADGFDVPMICGRGLGHTGGTVDKLESIPGFKAELDFETFQKAVEKKHGAFSGQSGELVPADKKIYALRDVTSTVENIGLITASILSKKLAEGLNGLMLDVKIGSGAFMRDIKDAEALARNMVHVACALGCRTVAALTNMQEPLGRSAGNALEVAECLDVLGGAGPRDMRELSLQLAAGAAAAGRNECNEKGIAAAYARMQDHLQSGRAYEIFVDVAVSQGARVEDLERRNTKWIYGEGNVTSIPVFPKEKGVVTDVDTRELGLAIVEMGGQRLRKEDKINPFVGYTEFRKIGEDVDTKEAPLCYIHLVDLSHRTEIEKRVRAAFKIGPVETLEPLPLIHSWIYPET